MITIEVIKIKEPTTSEMISDLKKQFLKDIASNQYLQTSTDIVRSEPLDFQLHFIKEVLK